jgi:hypothetical protein
MTMAICFKCGKMKFGAFTQCPECNGEPKTDDELVVSLVMTDHIYNGEEMELLGENIKKGIKPEIAPEFYKGLLNVIRQDRNK